MTDLIKREDAIKAVLNLTMYKGSVPVDSVIYNIKHIPSAEELIYEEIQKADIEAKAYAKGFKEGLEARKQGEWIPIIEGNEFGETYQSGIYCSECGETLGCEANFCPNCGAKMKGADDE